MSCFDTNISFNIIAKYDLGGLQNTTHIISCFEISPQDSPAFSLLIYDLFCSFSLVIDSKVLIPFKRYKLSNSCYIIAIYVIKMSFSDYNSCGVRRFSSKYSICI